MAAFTDSEEGLLKQFTTTTRRVYADCLKIRKRDYDGFVPRDILEMREMKKKLQEHDGVIEAVKRSALQLASFWKK